MSEAVTTRLHRRGTEFRGLFASGNSGSNLITGSPGSSPAKKFPSHRTCFIHFHLVLRLATLSLSQVPPPKYLSLSCQLTRQASVRSVPLCQFHKYLSQQNTHAHDAQFVLAVYRAALFTRLYTTAPESEIKPSMSS